MAADWAISKDMRIVWISWWNQLAWCQQVAILSPVQVRKANKKACEGFIQTVSFTFIALVLCEFWPSEYTSSYLALTTGCEYQQLYLSSPLLRWGLVNWPLYCGWVTHCFLFNSFDRHALDLLERMLTLDPEYVSWFLHHSLVSRIHSKHLCSEQTFAVHYFSCISYITTHNIILGFI